MVGGGFIKFAITNENSRGLMNNLLKELFDDGTPAAPAQFCSGKDVTLSDLISTALPSTLGGVTSSCHY